MNFRTAKWRVDIAMWCDVEYSGNALGYQTWNIRFEGKLTSLRCSASFYAIPFNFSPLAKLCFSLSDCIIHQLWGAWFCISLLKCQSLTSAPFVSMLPCAELSCSCSFSERFSFSPRRQNFMLSQKREWKIKYPLLSDIFLCLYSKLNIIGHCIY